ncbi:PH domain-containing protein [Shewanella goraebulensis]|uniref:PH domain-containing protein n=1 Tax=Shewanella goraebulensis TaxID=3050637 RepID=UPI00254A6D80|nr:PH domain-containing protein [Shewanella goraebulensis]
MTSKSDMPGTSTPEVSQNNKSLGSISENVGTETIKSETIKSETDEEAEPTEVDQLQVDAMHAEHISTPNEKTLQMKPQWTPYTELSLTPVDKNYPKQIAIQTAGLVCIVIAAVMFIMNIKEQAGLLVSLKVSSVLGLLGFIAVYIQFKAAKNLSYGVLEHEIIVRKGLWWITTTTLPFTRLQHVSLSQNPLQRRFSLATLKCFSAGSGAAEIYLPGLLYTTAEHLRQHLLNKATSHQTKQVVDNGTSGDIQND